MCALRTSLKPLELLSALKTVERDLGRVERERWGPREIDCDLLLYGDAVMRAGSHPLELDLPHPRIAERDFVLQPLAEIAPEAVHPVSNRTIAALDRALGGERLQARRWPAGGAPLGREDVHYGRAERDPGLVQRRRRLRGRRGRHRPRAGDAGGGRGSARHWRPVDAIRRAARPPEEEIRRAAPVVRGLLERGLEIPISVDTFSATVADELVSLGASIVNDVSGGVHDRAADDRTPASRRC